MKLCLALDGPHPVDLARSLRDLPPGHRRRLAVKVGPAAFLDDPSCLDSLRDVGVGTVLDLKFHDIPNTMRLAAQALRRWPHLEAFTVHAAAGKSALAEVRAAAGSHPGRPLVFAVTVLTSLGDGECQRLYGTTCQDQVKKLCEEVVAAGVDGVVCSPLELPHVPGELKKLVPGVAVEPRQDDQQRVGDLAAVVAHKPDYVVVGRPVYQHPSPLTAVRRILSRMHRLEAVEHSMPHLSWLSDMVRCHQFHWDEKPKGIYVTRAMEESWPEDMRQALRQEGKFDGVRIHWDSGCFYLE